MFWFQRCSNGALLIDENYAAALICINISNLVSLSQRAFESLVILSILIMNRKHYHEMLFW